jgi:MraZ protein
MRYVISGMTECVPDRQGRILIPPALRGEFDLEREVVLVGMLDHFEIWDRAAWEAERRLARENFDTFKQGLASLGLV